jgi:hypothetical protein
MSKAKVTDCRNHALTVFDGAVRVGSLVERAAVAGDPAFADMRAAARAIPPTRFATTGTPPVPQVCRGARHV